jgi:hypothetical protein
MSSLNPSFPNGAGTPNLSLDERGDSIFIDRQRRLLIEPLYSPVLILPGEGLMALGKVPVLSWPNGPQFTPDLSLTLDVGRRDEGTDWGSGLCIWDLGKAPDFVLEFGARGNGEESARMKLSSLLGIPFYAIVDPSRLEELGGVCVFAREHGRYREVKDYEWLAGLGLGLKLWHGEYEGHARTWLRWCDSGKKALPFPWERAERWDEQSDRRTRGPNKGDDEDLIPF